jgi:hypothetical protein
MVTPAARRPPPAARRPPPAARRAAARHIMSVLGLTERRACRLVGISRKVARYESCRKADIPLRQSRMAEGTTTCALTADSARLLAAT